MGVEVQRRRQWRPTPVLLPGKSHGKRSLVGCSPWGCWVGHDWVTSLSLFTFMLWRRKWQPTPVFLPGESQGWGAWWAAVYGVTQSQTRLKWLSSSRSREDDGVLFPRTATVEQEEVLVALTPLAPAPYNELFSLSCFSSSPCWPLLLSLLSWFLFVSLSMIVCIHHDSVLGSRQMV